MAYQAKVISSFISSKSVVVLLAIMGLTALFSTLISKCSGSGTVYVDRSLFNKMECDEYKVGAISNRRWENQAQLETAEHGCIKIELNKTPFVLNFNSKKDRPVKFKCVQLENGAYNAQIKCPDMKGWITLQPGNDSIDLAQVSYGACSTGPWQFIGTGYCYFWRP